MERAWPKVKLFWIAFEFYLSTLGTYDSPMDTVWRTYTLIPDEFGFLNMCFLVQTTFRYHKKLECLL